MAPLDLFKKLDQVVEKEAQPPDLAGAGSISGEEHRALGTSRARMEQGRRAADFVAERFNRFILSKISPRYPGLFTVRTIPEREAYETHAFGHLNPSAEHAICHVTFKGSNELYIRFSAIIMSAEFETEIGFRKARGDTETTRSMIRLKDHLKGEKIQWNGVFEAVLQEFIDWYSQVS